MNTPDSFLADYPGDEIRGKHFPVWMRRIINWEYWPFYIVYIPVFLLDLICAIVLRNPFYFKAVNPGMDNGGMYGQSKWKLYQATKGKYQPKTLFIPAETAFTSKFAKTIASELNFPVILKPDRGERGNGVHVLHRWEELCELPTFSYDNLMQEFHEYPLEIGAFYIRHPESDRGIISSLMFKQFYTVAFDGATAIGEYIERHPRLAMVKRKLKKRWGKEWHHRPEKGTRVKLVNTGNHNKGALFIDGRKWINGDLEQTIADIVSDMKDFHYGRLDIRTKSWAHLLKGDFILIEVNGAHSEPAHIYHPKFALFHALRDLIRHHYYLARIARHNLQKGFQTGSTILNIHTLRGEYNYRKLMP